MASERYKEHGMITPENLRWEDKAPEIMERVRKVLKFSGYRGRGVKNCLDQSLGILKILADYNHRYGDAQ
jgi:hypothetical protein